MLTHDEKLAHHAEQAATDAACLLHRAIEIVAAQLDTAREVAPAEQRWAKARALEIAAKTYPEHVAMVLDATTRIYTARIAAAPMARGGDATD